MLFSKANLAVLHTIRRDTLKQILRTLNTAAYDHYTSRIKTNESIANKLARKQLEPTVENAIQHLNDIIGIRIVTHYIHEVYTVVNLLKQEFDIQEECDYIAKPKASGYRSYHLILRVPVSKTSIPFPYGDHMTVEVQIRTMGMDFWASLEHSLVYDRTKTAGTLVPDSLSLVHNELLNYADNIFSIDMRIQALQHLTDETMPNTKE